MAHSAPSTNKNLAGFHDNRRSVTNRINKIAAAIGSATIIGVVGGVVVDFVQLMNPQLQPGYLSSEIGDHNGRCHHFIHRTPGTSIFVPQPPNRNMVQIAKVDAAVLLGKKSATGQEIWDKCRIYGPNRTTFSHSFTQAQPTP